MKSKGKDTFSVVIHSSPSFRSYYAHSTPPLPPLLSPRLPRITLCNSRKRSILAASRRLDHRSQWRLGRRLPRDDRSPRLRRPQLRPQRRNNRVLPRRRRLGPSNPRHRDIQIAIRRLRHDPSTSPGLPLSPAPRRKLTAVVRPQRPKSHLRSNPRPIQNQPTQLRQRNYLRRRYPHPAHAAHTA